MRKTCISLLLILLAATSQHSFADETVKLAIGDWEPYTSSTDSNSNLLERVVTEAFKIENIEAKYEYFPWKRSYLLTMEGKFDGTFPWAKTKNHMKEFYFHSSPLVQDEGVYFHLKATKFDWNTIEDLKKYDVGVTLGYKEADLYAEKGIKAQAVSHEYLNFKKLLAGRIDIYQTSKIVGYRTINKLFTPDQAQLFTNHPKPAVENEYFIMFSKKTKNGQELVEKFNSGLEKLKKSGAYDTLLIEYIGATR